MVDVATIGAVAALIAPVYLALFYIGRKIGCFERFCVEVDAMKEKVDELWFHHLNL